MTTNRIASLDANRNAIGAIAVFRPNVLRGALAALVLMLSALHSRPFISAALAESTAGKKSEGAQRWSVQVDKVDPGDVNLEPSFGAAIYENLVEELAKTKQFKQVFRSGDRQANDVSGLLILKTTVQKYRPGSETRRAVTTVSGATKLNVHIQLSTREGHLMLQQYVEGDVRFIGNNLRATHNLAHNVAVALKRSTLPEPTVLASEQEPGKMSQYQGGTIVPVQSHQAVSSAEPPASSYEDSVRVGNTVYVVLYAAPLGDGNARYKAGRDLLLLIGENSITYHDMLGNSLQVPILSRTTIANAEQWLNWADRPPLCSIATTAKSGVCI